MPRRLTYVGGDSADPETYKRLAQALGDASYPAFYLEIPPSLFATVVEGLSNQGLVSRSSASSSRSRSATICARRGRSRATCIATSTSRSCTASITSWARWGSRSSPICGSRTRCSSRSGTATTSPRFRSRWRRSSASSDAGSFYDPVGALRDVVENHMMQLLAAAAMEPPGAADAETLKDAKYDVFRAMADADPKQCVRGQYRGYRSTEGVKAGSTTETYIALRLEVNSWRWGGVPFFHADRQAPPGDADRGAPDLQGAAAAAVHLGPPSRACPNQIVVRIDPHTGVEIVLDAHRADRPAPSEIDFEMRFDRQGGEDPTPYEVLLHAALIGDSSHFTREDSVEETWRVVQPLLDSPPPARPYAKGSWGPTEADKLVERFGGWRSPWLPSSALMPR